MAYVLDYSAFYYSQRRRRRNGWLGCLAALAAVAAAGAIVLGNLCSEPSWRETVTRTFEDSKGEEASLQTLADRAFLLSREWGALRDDYVRMMPYLRLRWTPAPVTNVLDVAVRRLSQAPVQDLVPVSVVVENRKPASWVSKSAERPRSIELSIDWKTVRGLEDSEWSRALGAVSNWLSGVSFAQGQKAALSRVSSRSGKVRAAGDSISARFVFEGAHPLPFSDELGAVTGRLARVSSALAAISFGQSGVDSIGLLAVRTSIDKRDLERNNRDGSLDRSLEPGLWMETRFPVGSGSFLDKQKIVPLVYRAWDRAAESRLPWRNRPLRDIRRGPDFIGFDALSAFLGHLPDIESVRKARKTFDAKLVGLTNALPSSLFSSVDAERNLAGASRHTTSNLLPVGIGIGVLPRRTDLPGGGADGGGGVLTVSFPTESERGGELLFLDGVPDPSVRYVFSEWNYAFATSNAPLAAVSLSDRFVSFVAGGYGYEPARTEMVFSSDGSGISAFKANGQVPLALEGRAAKKEEPVRSATEEAGSYAGGSPESGK